MRPSTKNWSPFEKTPTPPRANGSGEHEVSNKAVLNPIARPRSKGNEQMDMETTGDQDSSKSMDLDSD